MTASTSTSMSVFHQWLLADPETKASACAIILHGSNSLPYSALIHEIAAYLNEYDDDGDGHWLPATDELVDRISNDPNHRRLLGLTEHPTEDSETEHRKVLEALAQRGHVISHSSDLAAARTGSTSTFHAGIGKCEEVGATCHLILNPELMDQKCICHVIGDVFLEWLHCDMRRKPPIQGIR